MQIRWLPVSRSDIARLYEFLYGVNPLVAARKIDEVLDAIERLPNFPRLGRQLDRMAPEEVRSWVVGDYEVRYEVTEEAIVILRIWHAREDR